MAPAAYLNIAAVTPGTCYHPDLMATTPAQRLERLRRHALAGWERARGDAVVRERAGQWLGRHPSPMPEVDQLWLAAIQGQGPLASWLAAGGVIESWPLAVPLHSVLACHPFPDLPQWTEAPK